MTKCNTSSFLVNPCALRKATNFHFYLVCVHRETIRAHIFPALILCFFRSDPLCRGNFVGLCRVSPLYQASVALGSK